MLYLKTLVNMGYANHYLFSTTDSKLGGMMVNELTGTQEDKNKHFERHGRHRRWCQFVFQLLATFPYLLDCSIKSTAKLFLVLPQNGTCCLC